MDNITIAESGTVRGPVATLQQAMHNMPAEVIASLVWFLISQLKDGIRKPDGLLEVDCDFMDDLMDKAKIVGTVQPIFRHGKKLFTFKIKEA